MKGIKADVMFNMIGYALDTSRTQDYLLVYIKVENHKCRFSSTTPEKGGEYYYVTTRHFVIFDSIQNKIDIYQEILDSRFEPNLSWRGEPITINMLKAINQQVSELKEYSNVGDYLKHRYSFELPKMADNFDNYKGVKSES